SRGGPRASARAGRAWGGRKWQRTTGRTSTTWTPWSRTWLAAPRLPRAPLLPPARWTWAPWASTPQAAPPPRRRPRRTTARTWAAAPTPEGRRGARGPAPLRGGAVAGAAMRGGEPARGAGQARSLPRRAPHTVRLRGLVGALPSGARGRYRGWAHVRRADAGRAGAVAGEGGASCGPPRACERPPEGRALAGDCSPRPAGRSQEGRGGEGGAGQPGGRAWNGAGFALARDLCAAFAGAAQREKHPRRGGRGVGARRPGALGSAGVAGVGRDPRPLRVVTTITTGSFSLFSAFGCPYRA
ncbi:unnamed protein product, partial [Prorocentrum cordatum]